MNKMLFVTMGSYNRLIEYYSFTFSFNKYLFTKLLLCVKAYVYWLGEGKWSVVKDKLGKYSILKELKVITKNHFKK